MSSPKPKQPDPRRLALAAHLVASQGQNGSRWDLERICFPEQLQFIRDPSPFKVAVCTRRAGKSMALVFAMVDQCLREAHSSCLFLALTRPMAKKLVWKELCQLVDDFGLDAEIRTTPLEIKFGNGSMIYVSGIPSSKDQAKFKGLGYDLAIIDEVQDQGEFLQQMIVETIVPTFISTGGTLILSGVPGARLSGYWYDACHGNSHRYKVFSWTFADNLPMLEFRKKGPDQILSEMRELQNLPADGSGDTHSFRREYLGQWVDNHDVRVYKWSEANDFDDKDVVDDSTTYNVMGIDTGHNHADSCIVITVHPATRRMWVVYEWARVEGTDRSLDSLFNHIRDIHTQFQPAACVMDPASGGARFVDTLRMTHGIHNIETARKEDKDRFIQLLNDDLAAGRLFIKHSSQLAKESFDVIWGNRNKEGHRRDMAGKHSDVWDACLYAHRKALTMMGYNTQWNKKPVVLSWEEEHFRKMTSPQPHKDWWME